VFRSLILRRALTLPFLLLGVATLVFLAMALAPGDAADIYVQPGMPPEVIEQIRHRFGLDASLPVQYGRWLAAFVQGEMGYSHSYSMPVAQRLRTALPNTLLLASMALVLAFLVGTVVGVVQAVKQNSALDGALSFLTLFFYSMPSFWLALMLILIFSVGAGVWWDWPVSFPASGLASPGADLLGPWDRLLDRIHHLVLPVTTLTLLLAGGVARYVRASMLDVVRQDYIRTARAKGLPESKVILKHALRNGLIPVVTLVGSYFPLLLSGAVLVEYVFSWPGMGQVMVESIHRRDMPVVMAGTVLFGAMVVVGNLMADLLYGVVDPRIRDGRE